MPEIGLILAEDEALKAKLSYLTVPDPTQPDQVRKVKVWYGMPSVERETIYPFVTIDLIDVVFASERAHSMEWIDVDWWPSVSPDFQGYADLIGMTTDPDVPFASTTLFHPYDLYYQVATHCRYALQDRHLTAQLLSSAYMPLSNIGTLHVPADETQRWLDNLGSTRADYRDLEEKTVFRKVYTVKVSAHMAVTDPVAYRKVLQVAASITGITDGEQYASWTYDAPA